MDFKLIGEPCGQHGPYTFYKALKYTKNDQTNILALSEFFFVKLWTDSDLISIGELQLLWEDKNSEQTLASLRLYILPENTPDGRCDNHGEDEVLAITEKVVMRVEDLLTWITEATDWHWGLGAVWDRDCPSAPSDTFPGPNRIAIDMEDVTKEKQQLDPSHWERTTGVVVLSYPRYCRYRGILKRLEGVHNKWLRTTLVVALGGFTAPCKNTRVLFCKETFDYPELEGHELLCNHLAPKLKGRPRRKRKKQSVSPEGSEESESESSQSTSSSTSKPKIGLVKPRLRCTLEVNKRPTRGPSSEEKSFLIALHAFMNGRKTPIGRIPVVGFKEVNLFKLYRKVTELGGYDMVTTGKLWKHVYEVMGGDIGSTSAATLSRRHYEKLLLPYERHINGRAQFSKITKALPPVEVTPVEPKQEFKAAPKSSSLRSIRLKQEKVVGVGEKENIPQKGTSVTAVKEPEVIDLVSDESPVKISPPPLSPMLKKQKLEILKEGGLEVTPIGGRVSVIKHSTVGPAVSSTPATSLKSPPPPPLPTQPNKISITVTPDMSHLMFSPGPSKKPVYGNPKEHLQLPPKKCPPTPEVLDLRTKPRTSLNIGSNLEITLVPPRGVPPPPVTPMPPPRRRQPPPPPIRTPLPKPPPPPRYLSPYKPAPFLPVDPIYLSALYNGIFAPPVYPAHAQPSQDHLHLYKELIRRQGMFPLLQDGSTSITLVGQTPTSK